MKNKTRPYALLAALAAASSLSLAGRAVATEPGRIEILTKATEQGFYGVLRGSDASDEFPRALYEAIKSVTGTELSFASHPNLTAVEAETVTCYRDASGTEPRHYCLMHLVLGVAPQTNGSAAGTARLERVTTPLWDPAATSPEHAKEFASHAGDAELHTATTGEIQISFGGPAALSAFDVVANWLGTSSPQGGHSLANGRGLECQKTNANGAGEGEEKATAQCVMRLKPGVLVTPSGEVTILEPAPPPPPTVPPGQGGVSN